jgi:hypothetical protein
MREEAMQTLGKDCCRSRGSTNKGSEAGAYLGVFKKQQRNDHDESRKK